MLICIVVEVVCTIYYLCERAREEEELRAFQTRLNELHVARYDRNINSRCEEVDAETGFCYNCEKTRILLTGSESARLKVMEMESQRKMQKEMQQSIKEAGKQIGSDIWWSRVLFSK